MTINQYSWGQSSIFNLVARVPGYQANHVVSRQRDRGKQREHNHSNRPLNLLSRCHSADCFTAVPAVVADPLAVGNHADDEYALAISGELVRLPEDLDMTYFPRVAPDPRGRDSWGSRGNDSNWFSQTWCCAWDLISAYDQVLTN